MTTEELKDQFKLLAYTLEIDETWFCIEENN